MQAESLRETVSYFPMWDPLANPCVVGVWALSWKGDHEIEGWVVPGEASGERVLVRSPSQSLSESEPRHRIPTVQCRICLVSFKGKPTASQGPELSAEALMATEDQVNPGSSLSPGVAEFLYPGLYEPFSSRCQMVQWWL